MKSGLVLSALLGSLAWTGMASAQSTAANVPVTVDNFARAESDLYFAGMLKDSGGAIGKFAHRREPARIDNQTVIRLNRDTLYSSALFDLDAGPVTITLPDPGKRFMSMQVINEDHYVPEVVYGKGDYTLTKDKVGTRYAVAAIRTLADPLDPQDLEQVHTLQDAIKVSQTAAGKFEAPNWDQASQKRVRDALLVLSSTIPSFSKAFGTKEQVDPPFDRHRIGMGWQPGQGRHLSQHHAGQKRRHDSLQAYRQGCAGQWVLVRQRVQRRGLFRKEPAKRLLDK